MTIIQSLLSALWAFSFLSIATFGITLIFKTSSTTNFAQGMLGIVGAYVTSAILNPNGITDVTGRPDIIVTLGVNLILPILAGIAVSFIFGFLIEFVIFRHAKYTNASTKQIITMGLVIIISGIIPLFFGIATRKSFPFDEGTLTLGQINIPIHNLITLIISVVLIAGIFILLKYTKWGLAVRSVSSNEKVAGLMGVNTGMINALSWAIAGALGAIAAITYTAGIATLNIGSMVNLQVNAFYSSVLGGFGTFHGPLIGSFIYSAGQAFIPLILSRWNIAPWSNTILYLLIMATVLIKPMGIFGKKTVKKV
jgi:branched-chain amino acid transport system permease protein